MLQKTCQKVLPLPLSLTTDDKERGPKDIPAQKANGNVSSGTIRSIKRVLQDFKTYQRSTLILVVRDYNSLSKQLHFSVLLSILDYSFQMKIVYFKYQGKNVNLGSKVLKEVHLRYVILETSKFWVHKSSERS